MKRIVCKHDPPVLQTLMFHIVKKQNRTLLLYRDEGQSEQLSPGWLGWLYRELQ